MNSSDVGAKIVKLRKEMGYTQATLAEALNVSNKTVSRWETGDGFPEITILPLLAGELGTTIDWLLSSDVRTSGGTVETSNKSSSVPPIFIILLVYEIFNLLGEVIPKLLLEKKIFNQGMVLLGGIDFFIMMASISLSIAMLLKFRRTGQKKEYRLTVIWASLLISTSLYKMWIRAIYIGFINAHMVSADIISLRDLFVVTFSIKLLEAILMVLCGWGTFEVLKKSAINKCNLLLLFSYIIVFGVTTIGIFAGKEMNNVLAVSMVSLIYVVSVIFILRRKKHEKVS